jgi:cytidine deaminase
VTDSPLDPEDAKLVTLARAARARNETPEGAAVRDETGRTYAATTVELPSLRLSAIQVAVAMAVCGGAASLEAAAVVTDASVLSTEQVRLAGADLAVVRDLGGANVPVHLASLDGALHSTVRVGGTGG